MARDGEDFPQYVDSEGYIYRVWPFENIVRYVPGGSKTMELSKVIGKFHHLAPDGNMMLYNGSYCSEIDGEMSATMVVKCATEKKLDMIETSAYKYHFTAIILQFVRCGPQMLQLWHRVVSQHIYLLCTHMPRQLNQR